MINYTTTEKKLMAAMAEMDIIDGHEHLPPESRFLVGHRDVFSLISHYVRFDLFSAGLDRKAYNENPGFPKSCRKEFRSLFDPEIPIEKRWKLFRPHWENVRYGSYARAVLLTAKQVYDVDDINDQTYHLLSERIAAESTPGIYDRILSQRCRIAAALTQSGYTDYERPLVPVSSAPLITQPRDREHIDILSSRLGLTVNDLDDWLALAKVQLDKWIGEGSVGIKISSQVNQPADRKAAELAFNRLLDGQKLTTDARGFEPLENFLLHHVIDLAGELDLTVAVHAGIWGDFRNIDSKNMLTLAPAHPQANFDLYHLGMPSVRDTIVIGKNMPNVCLNLCWTHIISQVQTRSGIDEIIDQVPINKIIAFGGDYGGQVENVVGHLHMAREDFAEVFGSRIDRGLMDFDEATHILKLWFWDNPLHLYPRLEV